MMQNPREEENFTIRHVLFSCLPSSGEGKHGGKTSNCACTILFHIIILHSSRPSEALILQWYILLYSLFSHVSFFLSIDASRDDGTLGRLVNDDHRSPNCKMKKIEVNGNPHLCLFALNDIKEGEEITYDYGGDDCPWRTQVCWTVHNVQNCSECCRMYLITL